MIKDFSLVIPAYNEGRHLKKFLDGLFSWISKNNLQLEIIIVNDGSTDNTREVLKAYANLIVIDHDQNRGYGSAIKTGVGRAAHEYVAIIDADATYPYEKFPELLSKIGEYDMVVGARKWQHISPLRRPAKYLINLLANYLSGQKIPDLNSGFRIFKKSLFQKYQVLLPNGFSLTTTITMAMLSNGHRLLYVPIDYAKRSGQSKIHPVKDTLNFVILLIRMTMYFEPLRIFLPISLILFLLGILSIAYDIFFIQNLSDKSVIFTFGFLFIFLLGMLADSSSRLLRK